MAGTFLFFAGFLPVGVERFPLLFGMPVRVYATLEKCAIVQKMCKLWHFAKMAFLFSAVVVE